MVSYVVKCTMELVDENRFAQVPPKTLFSSYVAPGSTSKYLQLGNGMHATLSASVGLSLTVYR